MKNNRKSLVVYCSRNHVIKTDFNGTCAEAMGYYIGKTFNIGVEDDLLVYGHAIEIDGISYNPSTHRYISDEDHARNLDLIAGRIAKREEIDGPRVGDFVYIWGAGEMNGRNYLRLTHDWGDSIQTSCLKQGDATEHGGFYSCKEGGTSYSGSLDGAVQKSNLVDTGEIKRAKFWAFNRDSASAHNGISFYMPCRVYRINPLDMPRPHKVRVVYVTGATQEFNRHGTPESVAAEFIGRFHYVDGKRLLIEKLQFFDGEIWQTYKRQARMIYSGGHGYVIDHGEKLGLEVYSEKHNGSKWFLDARRVQLLAIGNHGQKWCNFIEKEF